MKTGPNGGTSCVDDWSCDISGVNFAITTGNPYPGGSTNYGDNVAEPDIDLSSAARALTVHLTLESRLPRGLRLIG